MPCYKHRAYLFEAIEGIRKQTFDEWKLIVINDGDAKITYPLFLDDRIEVRNYSQHKGKSFWLNCIIPEIETEYIAFNDADDISLDFRFETCLQAMPYKYDLIYSDAIILNQDGTKTYSQAKEFDLEALKIKNYITFSTVIVKTELAQKVEFDGGYAEDYRWYNKISQWTDEIMYVPIPTVYYRNYTSNFLSNNTFLRKFNRRFKKR